jgi:VIT1/CCC1 family predicted Fe2+/Mn2+ transporter
VGLLAKDRNTLVKALARERLDHGRGIEQAHGLSRLRGLSTAVGAFIPIISFFSITGIPEVTVAAIVSPIAHFAVGAAKSLITIRSW